MGAYRLGMMEELEKAHVYIEQLNDRVREQDDLLSARQQTIVDQQSELTRQQAELDKLKTKVAALSALEARRARLEHAHWEPPNTQDIGVVNHTCSNRNRCCGREDRTTQ